MNLIIEGIDHIGKDTLINNIKIENDIIIHSGKPESFEQQRKYFEKSARFSEIMTNQRVIFNRFHIGEMVYGPLYRNTPGEWVYPLVETSEFIENTKLVLLRINDFSLREYDMDAFDFDNAKNEQNLFLSAFDKSRLTKIIIDVDYNGEWKNPKDITEEVLDFFYYSL